jgi:predicted nucleic acid-binding protein
MSADRVFIDTNVLASLFDDSEPKKQESARARLQSEQRRREIVVSTQVLQELYVALTKSHSPIATPDIAEKAVREASGFTVIQIDTPLILSGIAASQAHRLSFWDALILCAAAQAGCDLLISEDLNDGQVVDGVRIENPFVSSHG